MLSESGSTGRPHLPQSFRAPLASGQSPATAPDLRTVLDQAGRLSRLAADSTLPPTDALEVWPPTLTVPPPRWNFAGYCLYCTRRGCRSRRCATEWNRAVWAVCITCSGRGHDAASANPCACIGGLMEIDCD